jgi:flagellar FliL protein
MSDDFGDLGLGENDLAQGLEKKKFSGKQLVLFVVLPLLLLGGGGLAVWTLFSGPSDDVAEDQEKIAEAKSKEPKQMLFYDVPEMLVNLNSTGAKPTYLKIKISLEVDRQSSIAELDAKLPRVIDNFQIYLRELRLEDLNGSAGMFRLKEELLARVNTALYPTQVKDVLFKEMLVQ